ncbi:MAG: potassium transporter TrkG, partial [Oscillospiraceae bacterium]|nr:potassium transporter TrkG [Oscillospiraceae bacterium]
AYMIILFFSALIVSLDELDFTSAFTASLTCISNVGPGLGLVGPTCNFGFLSPLSKLVLSFTMLLGRLEIMPLLVLFLPSVWRKK